MYLHTEQNKETSNWLLHQTLILHFLFHFEPDLFIYFTFFSDLFSRAVSYCCLISIVLNKCIYSIFIGQYLPELSKVMYLSNAVDFLCVCVWFVQICIFYYYYFSKKNWMVLVFCWHFCLFGIFYVLSVTYWVSKHCAYDKFFFDRIAVHLFNFSREFFWWYFVGSGNRNIISIDRTLCS